MPNGREACGAQKLRVFTIVTASAMNQDSRFEQVVEFGCLIQRGSLLVPAFIYRVAAA